MFVAQFLPRGQKRQRAPQPLDHALLTQHHHRVKQRRRHRPSHNRDARSVYQQPSLHTLSRRHYAQSPIASVMIPLRQSRQRLSQFRQQPRNFLILPEFLARFLLVFKLIRKKCPRPTSEIRQQTSPRPNQIHRMREPSPLGRSPLILPQPRAPQFCFHIRQQLLHRRLLQILRVVPLQLRAIEYRIRPAHARKRKPLDQFRSPHEFAVIARGPSQQRQKIPERLRQKSFVRIRSHARRPVPLRKPRAVRPQNQRHVRENRRRRPQRVIDQHLLRRIRQMIRAANNVRDAHINVVHHHAQLISRHAARAQQHKILDVCVLYLTRPKNRVLEFRHARARSLEPDRPRRTFLLFRRAFRIRKIAARARHSLQSLRPLVVPFAFVVLILRRGIIPARVSRGLAVASVTRPARQYPLRRGPIHFPALRLKERPLVPLNPQPLQRHQYSIHQFGLVALHVGVFHAQQQCPALVFREKPVEQSSARSAHMQISGRRRRKTHARFLCSTHSVGFLPSLRAIHLIGTTLQNRESSQLATTSKFSSHQPLITRSYLINTFKRLRDCEL